LVAALIGIKTDHKIGGGVNLDSVWSNGFTRDAEF
jgi:hypothetical protein